MLLDMIHLFQLCDPETKIEDYFNAIIEQNVLGKQTLSSRKLTAQRMRELYGLDTKIPLFRVMRQLWDVDEKARPLLAIMTCLTRDPILRITSIPILNGT